jgi:hypothetical protein
MNEKIITVALPDGKIALLTYRKNKTGHWVSTLDQQSMIDLQALLNGEEPKQEYVELTAGDIPSWVTL